MKKREEEEEEEKKRKRKRKRKRSTSGDFLFHGGDVLEERLSDELR